MDTNTIYFAGGCLWGVQAFIKTLPGVVDTEAGRANGETHSLNSHYDGYAECVKTTFDESVVSVALEELAELGYLNDYDYATLYLDYASEKCYGKKKIDPYSINRQGNDVGLKYRTGIYSENANHIEAVIDYIARRNDSEKIVVEVKLLTNYVKSADEHQDRLSKYPNDYCHIPKELLTRYRK